LGKKRSEIDEGKIIALGSPREIQSQTMGQSLIEVHCAQPLPDNSLPAWSDAAKTLVSPDRKVLSVYSQRPAPTLVDIVKWIEQQGIDLEDIHLKRPSLEDVFIARIRARRPEQIDKFLHTDFTIVPYEAYVTLAERLLAVAPISGPKKAAFFNSGYRL
jgi:hypothetical protein